MIGPRLLQMRPTGAQVTTLAIRIADHARAIGFSSTKVEASLLTRSSSRYVKLVDQHRRPWIVRVSDHPDRRRHGHAKPHFDLVTRDGQDGYQPACAFLDRVVGGSVVWTDPMAGVRQPKRRRKG